MDSRGVKSRWDSLALWPASEGCALLAPSRMSHRWFFWAFSVSWFQAIQFRLPGRQRFLWRSNLRAGVIPWAGLGLTSASLQELGVVPRGYDLGHDSPLHATISGQSGPY